MQRAKRAPRTGGQPKKRSITSSEEKASQDGPPPFKKAKTNPLSPPRINRPTTSTDKARPTSTSTPPSDQSTHAAIPEVPVVAAGELTSTHDVTSISIVSSSHMRQKVTRALDILSVYPAPANEKARVVMFRAKAQCASKMISIAEIAKREVGKEGGKWFQYSAVGPVMVERKGEGKAAAVRRGKEGGSERRDGLARRGGEDGAEDEGSEDESTAFETMKTPFERANEGKAKMRAVPVMTIYLSRVRVDGLRKAYGEQTNALPLQKERG